MTMRSFHVWLKPVIFAQLLCIPFVYSFNINNNIYNGNRHKWKGDLKLDVSTSQMGDSENISSSTLPQEQYHSCQFCDKLFLSRNALFRHLRTDTKCYHQASVDEDGIFSEKLSRQLPRQKAAIRFGYHVHDIENNSITTTRMKSQNEVAAEFVKKIFFDVLGSNQPVEPLGSETITQASTARHRHPCLSQDFDCSSSSDFVCINFKGEPIQNLTLLQNNMQKKLDDTLVTGDHDLNNCHLSEVKILDIGILPTSSKFQAEQSCTQRIYHYLLPIEWMEGGDDATRWFHEQWLQEKSTTQRSHQPRGSAEPPEVLLRLKRALKSFESSNVSENDRGNKISSPGRFGSLWKRERRCWHNFADPTLGGKASPSNDPVWRAVDKARLVGVASYEGSYAAVIEIRGDGFVAQQIRRMMASILAVTNEWLPLDFAHIATRSDVCIETPLAPPGKLYLSGARYHFMELEHGGSLFEENLSSAVGWQRQLQSKLLQSSRVEKIRDGEQAWLRSLRDEVIPRIKKHLSDIARDDKIRSERTISDFLAVSTSTSNHLDAKYPSAPAEYEQVLSMLRVIVEQMKWPRTSKARSRVIRSINTEKSDEIVKRTGPEANTFAGESLQYGSFTVVNEAIVEEKLPLGNQLFPNLVKAVFTLEAELALLLPGIAEGAQRPDGIRSPSTHCAINRNAEFVPHTDSGKGQGQSISMIVALGDFVGGSVVIEGQPYNIQYNPLEFDGWKQRHWTEPFQGERYSLVWFTPEGMSAASADEECSDEEITAKRLVLQHQRLFPTFPSLQFRPKSTDLLVIKEILDSEKGCVYELKNHIWNEQIGKKDFSPRGHNCVLDIGAHIGVFARFALSTGCSHIIVYEPEPSNLELLRRNLAPINGDDATNLIITVHEAAVANGVRGIRQLVHARSRNDGTMNTWRHSLEEYSQYVDKATKLPSASQEGTLTRSEVWTVPFFGDALRPGITFVKLDCEGAEIDILLSEQAAMAQAWMDVNSLVFEWSFTKEKRVSLFQKAVSNLKEAGFAVYYEGQGAWWEQSEMWPYHTDLLVYAMRFNNYLQ